MGVGLMMLGSHVGRRSWQKETRLRNMFWSVGCSGIGLRHAIRRDETIEAINPSTEKRRRGASRGREGFLG